MSIYRRAARRLLDRRTATRRRLDRHFAAGGDPLVLTDQYGMRFILHSWELDLTDQLLSKSFDKPDFRVIDKLLRPGDSAVDVGANVGAHSIMMSRRVGPQGRVIAFEPVPSTAWLMREGLALNRVENVQLFEAAVTAERGTVEMNVFDQRHAAWNSRGSTTIDGMAPIATVEVPAMTLDETLRDCGWEHVRFLKIDVEGFELDALEGARRLLTAGAVDYLGFEVSELPLKASGHTASEIFGLLASLGYHCYKFDEPSDSFIGPFEDSDDYYVNFYASRLELPLPGSIRGRELT